MRVVSQDCSKAFLKLASSKASETFRVYWNPERRPASIKSTVAPISAQCSWMPATQPYFCATYLSFKTHPATTSYAHEISKL
jgi:hypothetical protein